MTGPPDLRDLVGDDLPDEERARLERVHELVAAAGPPPELPPALLSTPAIPHSTVGILPRRRRGALLLIAAALAAIAFGAGYLLGDREHGYKTDFTVAMHGTAAAPAASATILLAPIDGAGNWPMQVRVRGLRELPRGGYYTLLLTRHGRAAAKCGTFLVHGGDVTTVTLNAPYKLKTFDGWIVTRRLPGQGQSPALLTT